MISKISILKNFTVETYFLNSIFCFSIQKFIIKYISKKKVLIINDTFIKNIKSKKI